MSRIAVIASSDGLSMDDMLAIDTEFHEAIPPPWPPQRYASARGRGRRGVPPRTRAEEAATEDYSLHVVPRTWRVDRGKLTIAWYAVMSAFVYMCFSAFIALGYGTWNAVTGIALTVFTYTAVNVARLRGLGDRRARPGLLGGSIDLWYAIVIFAIAPLVWRGVHPGSIASTASSWPSTRSRSSR